MYGVFLAVRQLKISCSNSARAPISYTYCFSCTADLSYVSLLRASCSQTSTSYIVEKTGNRCTFFLSSSRKSMLNVRYRMLYCRARRTCSLHFEVTKTSHVNNNVVFFANMYMRFHCIGAKMTVDRNFNYCFIKPLTFWSIL